MVQALEDIGEVYPERTKSERDQTASPSAKISGEGLGD